MTWLLSLWGHHDDPTHNGANSPSIREAVQHLVDELRGQGHQITTQPTINSQPVSVDVTKGGNPQ